MQPSNCARRSASSSPRCSSTRPASSGFASGGRRAGSSSALAPLAALEPSPNRLRPARRKLAALALLACGTGLTAGRVSADAEWWALLLLCLGAAGAGTIFPLQACVNDVLRSHLGTPFRATAVSFAVGAVALAAVRIA